MRDNVPGRDAMIDPITAITAATAAFNTVKKFVHAGQDFENCMGQMGKWYAGVSDFRKGQQMQKNQPVFRKMEKELQEMLNVRFGYKTWDELKQLQRKIRTDRQKQIYDVAERRQAFINGTAITLLLGAMVCTIAGIFYFIALAKGMI